MPRKPSTSSSKVTRSSVPGGNINYYSGKSCSSSRWYHVRQAGGTMTTLMVGGPHLILTRRSMDQLLEARQIPTCPRPGGGRGQAHQSTHRRRKRSQPHLRQHVEKDGLGLNGHARPKQVSLLRHCPRQRSASTWHGGPSSHLQHEGELPYRVHQI
jgi:hypothetical protein